MLGETAEPFLHTPYGVRNDKMRIAGLRGKRYKVYYEKIGQPETPAQNYFLLIQNDWAGGVLHAIKITNFLS